MLLVNNKQVNLTKGKRAMIQKRVMMKLSRSKDKWKKKENQVRVCEASNVPFYKTQNAQCTLRRFNALSVVFAPSIVSSGYNW